MTSSTEKRATAPKWVREKRLAALLALGPLPKEKRKALVPHRLRSPKQRLFDQGAWLASWLNEGKERNGDKSRVLTLLSLVAALEQELQGRRGKPPSPAAVKIEEQLAAITRRYETWPRVACASDSTYIAVAHMWERGASLEESIAFNTIEALLKDGLLGRLARCVRCRKRPKRWVFRSKSDRRYCSRQCRQAVYERTEKRKQKKRVKNKEYYERLFGKGGKKHE